MIRTVCTYSWTPRRPSTVIVQAVAGSEGSFHAVVPTPPGQSILTVTVTAGGHATGWAQQTVTAN